DPADRRIHAGRRAGLAPSSPGADRDGLTEMVYAVLTGTRQRPRIEVADPCGHEGEMLAARLPDTMGFEVDAETRRCITHAPTSRLIAQLREAGIVLAAFEFPETLASLRRPLVIDLADGRIEVFP